MMISQENFELKSYFVRENLCIIIPFWNIESLTQYYMDV